MPATSRKVPGLPARSVPRWARRAAGVVLGALLGCVAMGPKMAHLSPGMGSSAVEQTLGRPDGVSQIEGYTVWHYNNRLASNSSSDRADYYVVLDADTVVGYGQGAVRPGPRGAVPVIVLPQ